jgi:hypothetical protein
MLHQFSTAALATYASSAGSSAVLMGVEAGHRDIGNLNPAPASNIRLDHSSFFRLLELRVDYRQAEKFFKMIEVSISMQQGVPMLEAERGD